MKFWKDSLMAYLGGMAYASIELLWRGRTHSSMFVLGGICFVLIGRLGRTPAPLPLPLRMLASAGIITTLELGCGLLVNRDYSVWDYRHLPMNYHGQICLPFSLLWIGISLGAICLYDWLDKAVFRLTFEKDIVK